MFGKHFLAGAILLILSLPTWADVNVALRHVDNADLVGEARLKVMFWDVFDAKLYAGNGRYDDNEPFALSLSYLRELKASRIVEATIDEMRRQGQYTQAELMRWKQRLSGIIRDVDHGTTITGIRDEFGHTVLYRDNERLGLIEDPRFTKGFFAIWLGEKTTQPALRDSLLGSRQS